ncbi:putative serine threonine protein kinase [Paratrimastix pyriformis]|uniref:Serine threonine protein kinase n=1 Tax=Paratrimastix pyriformis TaxID=342808 RepID=A0ABQ8ULJ4_9EUKA|nr:putative serine threonine protein kinase [Paratrimastix pyriformis]
MCFYIRALPTLGPSSLQPEIFFYFSWPLKMSDTAVVLSEWQIRHQLGKGTFGKVYKVSCPRIPGSFFALKKSLRTDAAVEFRHEFETHVKLAEARTVVQAYLLYENPLAMILELCEKGDMGRFFYMPELGDLPARQVGFYFRTLCSALLAMDAQNLAHRDLKLENLFISSDFEMKVADFGMAITLPPGQTDCAYCGSPEYMAPEVALRQPYTPKIDVWSAGVVLYVMIMRRYPFNAPFTSLPQATALVAGLPWAEVERRAGPGPRRLLEGMLRVDPTQRLTIQQVVQDPWVQSVPTYGQPGYEELAAESRLVMAAREAKCLGDLNTPPPSVQSARCESSPVFMGPADVHVADYSALPLLPADARPVTYFLLKGPSVLEIQQQLRKWAGAAGAPAEGWRDGALEATLTAPAPLGLLLRLYRSPKDHRVVQLLVDRTSGDSFAFGRALMDLREKVLAEWLVGLLE